MINIMWINIVFKFIEINILKTRNEKKNVEERRGYRDKGERKLKKKNIMNG